MYVHPWSRRRAAANAPVSRRIRGGIVVAPDRTVADRRVAPITALRMVAGTLLAGAGAALFWTGLWTFVRAAHRHHAAAGRDTHRDHWAVPVVA